jgi:putative acetyltransferase
MYLHIRPETPVDAGAIETITLAAFLDAPHTSRTEHLVIRALRDAGALTISLVAEADRRIAGHVAISPVTVSGGIRDWYGLGPVAVAPRLQGYYGRFGFRCEAGLKLPAVPAEYFQAVAFRGVVPRGTVAFHAAFAVTT